ncbi:uncharacterized protein Z519_06384 [Cladophialophora bantiana CBS 173.52]|uniref:Uncharacterized protein n=1 Tax=Cladophialophora bantiana (strain ATCC 10958 / CBS 173.52 / CDC B-1940 / NIH 8579) TaxID=1442370 RepID=A0A0D2G1E7_CLAB1|nr:uncharacterized protein Z519_06384 [Cladophialophora bantiana CBS 173.52]KIW92537.1 hypothetical protein Z519_06384 [Cladophialophora bantiana CBS 173.52]
MHIKRNTTGLGTVSTKTYFEGSVVQVGVCLTVLSRGGSKGPSSSLSGPRSLSTPATSGYARSSATSDLELDNRRSGDAGVGKYGIHD